jgi:putative flavoprotein involved in K+ transport
MTSRRRSPSSHFDTIVIGGGQAGLTLGYYLTQQECEFTILDASERIGETWRNRWESLRLFTQAQYSGLPGFPFPAPDDYYPTKDEIADYLEAYAARFDLPVQLETRVETLTRSGNHYVLAADSQRFHANHVVVATGSFHHPHIPDFADELTPSITQFHSTEYRTPDQLPDGPVLVVGAGNSGAEIATELARSGQHTLLSGQSTGSISLRLFNNSVFWWVFGTALTVDTWVGRKLIERSQDYTDPLIRSSETALSHAEVTRVPRTDGVIDGQPRVADGRVLDIATVIWATGFRPEFDWIELSTPIFEPDGSPIHHRGVVESVPGLYFLGLPDQSAVLSATLGGVCPDARYIAEHLRPGTDSESLSSRVATGQRAACTTDIRYLLGLR